MYVQAEVRLADLAEERRGAQRVREAAEAAHVAAVDAATIRGEVLGCDRADRHYWWFPGVHLTTGPRWLLVADLHHR